MTGDKTSPSRRRATERFRRRILVEGGQQAAQMLNEAGISGQVETDPVSFRITIRPDTTPEGEAIIGRCPESE